MATVPFLDSRMAQGKNMGGIANFTHQQIRYLEKDMKHKSKYLDMCRQIKMKNKHIFLTEEEEKSVFKKSKTLSKVEQFAKWINEPVDDDASQESCSHNNAWDTCRSTDSRSRMCLFRQQVTC